jgi:hypothetical protein
LELLTQDFYLEERGSALLNFDLFCNFFEPVSQGSGVEFDKHIFTHFTNFRGCFPKGNVAKFLRFSSIVQLSNNAFPIEL